MNLKIKIMTVGRFLSKQAALTVLVLGMQIPGASAQILLNEYSCANLKSTPDNFAKYEDWIELYNGSLNTIDLGGYHLSDDVFNMGKFTIPAGTVLNPFDVKIIWASGRGTNVGGQVHANFKLSQTKNTPEVLILSNPSNVVIDSIRIRKTKLAQSRGRISNGAATWSVFTTPTPGSANSGSVYIGYADRPTMSYSAGFYPAPVTVSLTNNEPSSVNMYYTTDGTEPTTLSTLYTGPINIATTSVVKAIATSTNPSMLPSFIEFNTYFINENHTIPVVSIAGTSLNTLANGTKTLTPDGSIEYFNTLKVRTSTSYGGFNSHGQDSWAHSHRSLDFVARDEMGYSSGLKEKVFSQTTRDKFQRLILRAAGDDNYPADFDPNNAGSAHLRDAYFQTLCKAGGMKLDIRTASKCVVYLNGTYWGVYDLREIPDDHDYTDYYYGQGKYDIQYILTWGNTWAEYGGNQAITDWNTLRTYIFNNTMSVQANFDYVASQLDVESLSDYVIGHSMSVSSDWLNYNTGWWRGLNPSGGHKKWGYILWDNDASFDHYINYTNIPSTNYNAPVCQVDNLYLNPWSDPQQHTRVLKRLRDNPGFNQWYVSRYADLMNTTFSCKTMLDFLDSTKAVIDPEMTRQAQRWGGSYSGWITNFNKLRTFIVNRCGANGPNGMTSCYNLTGPYPVTFSVNPTGAANIGVNSLTITQLPWKANYFGNIDINLKSTPYSINTQFIKWESLNNPFLVSDVNNANKIKLTKSDTITAKFAVDVSVREIIDIKATEAMLFPNPTSEGCTLSFYIPEKTSVSVKILNVAGQEVGRLATDDREFESGSYTVDINSAFTSGLKDGIYFVRLDAKDYGKTFKLVLQR